MASPRVAIDALPAATDLTPDDLFIIQDAGVTKKLTASVMTDKKVDNGGGVTTIVALDQAAYDAIATKDSATLYIVTDGGGYLGTTPLWTTGP